MSIAEKIAGAGTYLVEHPDEARYRDFGARARLEAELSVVVDGPSGEALRTDMPAAVGGTGRSPSPGWYFRAAQASCVAALVGMRAATLGIALDAVEVEVDSESDDRGILGLDPAIPAGPLSGRVAVTIRAADRTAEEIEALGRWAVDHCPVVDALRRAVPTEVEIRSA
jgi:uncharacterized OsmC-like protein